MKTIFYTSGKLLKGQLILRKPYEVLFEYPGGYVIINEMDIPTWYDKKHFTKDIDYIRKEKLDNLIKQIKKDGN